MKQIFVLLVLIGIITTLAPTVGATVLWVVPDNPTGYIDVSDDDDFPLSEIVMEGVIMGSTFEGNVIVLKQTPPTDEEAVSVFLKFFVGNEDDASNIESITIGTAKRIQAGTIPPTIIMDKNKNSDPDIKDLTFSPVDKDHPVPAGYGVKYLIGDIPFSGGPSQTGDPEEDLSDFDPNKADYYIIVPFTINFKSTPEVGFTLYAYAENCKDCGHQKCAKTAYSHDAGFTHVPEFTTIAIPVASILGLLFFFNHRKRRKAK
jgi:hypothetical protein